MAAEVPNHGRGFVSNMYRSFDGSEAGFTILHGELDFIGACGVIGVPQESEPFGTVGSEAVR